MADSAIVYVENGTTYYRASSLGMCPTAFIFARQGHETRIPPNMQRAFDEGNTNEPRIVDRLVKKGWNITHNDPSLPVPQMAVFLPISDNSDNTHIRVVGHIDGFANRYKGALIKPTLCEFKSFSADNFAKFISDPWRHFPYYALQISAYWYAIPIQVNLQKILFGIHNKATDEIKEVLFDAPPIPLDDIKALVLSYEQAYERYQRSDELPVCNTSRFCPFWHLHDQINRGAKDVELVDPQVRSLVIAHGTIKAKIDTLNKLLKLTDDKLKPRLDELSITDGKVNDYSVNYSHGTQNRVDTQRLKDDGIYDKYLQTVANDRLTIKATD